MKFARSALLAGLAASMVMAGCSSSDSADDNITLTVYTDQHLELVEQLTEAYTKETGVEFQLQPDATVGQIQAEKDASPADVFLSEDPGPVAQMGAEGMLDTLDDEVFDGLRKHFSSPDHDWAAYAARTRVAYYNPQLIDKDDMPKKLADIVKPKYKDKFAWAPSGAFVSTVQYMIAEQGKEKTTEFLKKVKENGANETSNGNVRDTVEAGRHAFGLSNHYYWWIKADEVGGPENMTSKTYHFPGDDVGNLALSSGAGVLKTSKDKDEAEDFVSWLTSQNGGQAIIADSTQYPVREGMSSNVVGSLDDVKSPSYDMDLMADYEQAEQLLKQLGMSN